MKFVVRIKWKCDTRYKEIEADTQSDVIHSLEVEHRLVNVEPSVSSSQPEYDVYVYNAKHPKYGLMIIEIVEFKNPHNIWGEIRSNYTDDDNGWTYIDAWVTPNDNEEGYVIAIVKENGEVDYKDSRAKTDKYAQEVISEVLNELKMRKE